MYVSDDGLARERCAKVCGAYFLDELTSYAYPWRDSLYIHKSALRKGVPVSTRHIIESQQFTLESIEALFEDARRIEGLLKTSRGRDRLATFASNKILTSFFYEESTRTRVSFEIAALLLGMKISSTTNASQFSSVAKGESFEHTIRILCGYRPDIIVLRHSIEGAARLAAQYSDNFQYGIPIINAGDGVGQHPTQALLDLFTIEREWGRLDNLLVVIGGDLLYGRTTHSLVYLLSQYPGNRFCFVSPAELAMKPDILDYLDRRGVSWSAHATLDDIPRSAQVIYWTRVQNERIADTSIRQSVERQKPNFVLKKSFLDEFPPSLRLLHPMPIVGEIESEIDTDSRAAYFRQAGNGLPVRMALLLHVLAFQKRWDLR